MSKNNFNGKAIYNPSGKAGEYSYWACNFYVGCSNMCEYCYCKKGILNNVMGMDNPQLKKCFKDETEALECFKKELIQNVSEIQKHGLFFSFTTDPMLEETHKLTWEAACFAMENNVPVKILTKCVGKWVDQLCTEVHSSWKKFLAIGFTLTGHDESRFYLKDTLVTLLKLDRDNLPGNFVRRDYNLFSDYEVCTEE